MSPRIPNPKELRKAAKERFLKARKAEIGYQKQLVSIGRQVGALVKGFAPDGVVRDMPGLVEALRRYSEVIKPWARQVTAAMHADVGRRDAQSWTELAREMGRNLRKEIFNKAPLGNVFHELMNEQVTLISSLPLDAAKRVHALTAEAVIQSTRAEETAKEILRSGKVTEGRAKLIARTETSRTASNIMEARAKYVGAYQYRWHTSHDSDVRPEHKKLDGKVFYWNDPPVAGPGMRYNPGCGPNCRCWAEPIIPD